MNHDLLKTASGYGTTLWMTGLSGAGKTTLAGLLAQLLKEQGLAVEWLDGDDLRRRLGKELGFSREDRFENIRRAVYLAEMLNRHGIFVIVSIISPYREMREYARECLPRFIEVYVDCPLPVCEQRDVKGLYAKARRGEISAFTGISDPYEPPLHAELVLNTEQQSPESCIQALMTRLNDGLLSP